MKNIIIQIFVAALAATTFCLVLIPIIRSISTRLNLTDKPNERKVHKQPISNLGGVGIFISAFAGLALSHNGLQAITIWPVLFSSISILFLLGIWDDMKDISAKLRFLIQICCATALAASGIRLTSLYGIMGIHEIEPVWQYGITIIIIVGSTNAFNLIDGIDGLAGGLSFISILVLGYVAYQLQLYPLVILLAAFAGGIAGFLKNNISPANIFMGDAGSLVLGCLISSVSILLIERAHAAPHLLQPGKVVVLIVSTLIIPVFDTIRVFVSRISKGKSPFFADKTHIHHLFLIMGFNHRKTSFVLYGLNIALVVIAMVLPGIINISVVIVIMLLLLNALTEVLNLNKSVEKWLDIIKKIESEDIT